MRKGNDQQLYFNTKQGFLLIIYTKRISNLFTNIAFIMTHHTDELRLISLIQ